MDETNFYITQVVIIIWVRGAPSEMIRGILQDF